MTIDQLTAEDYLYFEALADSELLDAGETGDFITICEQFVQHQDARRFISDIMIAAPIELRDATEIADAIKANVLNAGQPVLGNLAAPSVQKAPQPPIPAQQGQVRIPGQQQRPVSTAQPVTPMSQAPKMTAPIQPPPPPMPPQPVRQLPKIPVGFTAFGPLNLKQSAQPAPQQQSQVPPTIQQPAQNVAPQISVYSQKNISAPSAAVFPSNQAQDVAQESKPPASKSYEKGKDPYRENFS